MSSPVETRLVRSLICTIWVKDAHPGVSFQYLYRLLWHKLMEIFFLMGMPTMRAPAFFRSLF